jgi:hypothetical protein
MGTGQLLAVPKVAALFDLSLSSLARVSAETSVDKLRAMLKGHPNRGLPILNRMNELYEGQNLSVLFRLALHDWSEGMDDEAMLVLSTNC